VDADLARDLWYALLMELADGPGHAGALVRRLWWRVAYHNVRAVLLKLEREGHVRSEHKYAVVDGTPSVLPVRLFELTDSGKQIVADLDATFGPREPRMKPRAKRTYCARDHLLCFYCGAILSPRHEHDHFPVPARVGGTNKVSVCLNCHDLKDRVPLANWPLQPMAALMASRIADLFEAAVSEDFGRVSEIVQSSEASMERLLLAKLSTSFVCARADETSKMSALFISADVAAFMYVWDIARSRLAAREQETAR
jgi:hypothetical protein